MLNTCKNVVQILIWGIAEIICKWFECKPVIYKSSKSSEALTNVTYSSLAMFNECVPDMGSHYFCAIDLKANKLSDFLLMDFVLLLAQFQMG